MKSTTAKHIRLLYIIGALLTISVLCLLFAGCSTTTTAVADPKASSATQPESQTPPPVNNFLKQFGDTITWSNGVSVSVSTPADFVPNEESVGSVPGRTNLAFEIVLTNGSNEPLDPFVYTTASSGGMEASFISDLANPIGSVGFFPSTTLLPDQSTKWFVAYSVADPADITLEVDLGFDYDSGLFTNIPF